MIAVDFKVQNSTSALVLILSDSLKFVLICLYLTSYFKLRACNAQVIVIPILGLVCLIICIVCLCKQCNKAPKTVDA